MLALLQSLPPGVDWTTVLVQTLPPIFSSGFTALFMWLRYRDDVRLGRSMRPPKPKRRQPTEFENPMASQLDDPDTHPRKKKR